MDDIDVILASVGSGGSKKLGSKSKKSNVLACGFVGFLSGKGVRITYSGLTSVLRERGGVKACMPFSSPSFLSLDLQPFVCRDNGGYHERASLRWGDGALSVGELEVLMVLPSDRAVEAFDAWARKVESGAGSEA